MHAFALSMAIFFNLLAWLLVSAVALATASSATSPPSTAGLSSLVQRRIPHHQNSFVFQLRSPYKTSLSRDADEYTVSADRGGRIIVEGNSLSALASG